MARALVAFGAGSWSEIRAMPIQELIDLFVYLDQQRRAQRWETEVRHIQTLVIQGAKIHAPTPEEFGVL